MKDSRYEMPQIQMIIYGLRELTDRFVVHHANGTVPSLGDKKHTIGALLELVKIVENL